MVGVHDPGRVKLPTCAVRRRDRHDRGILDGSSPRPARKRLAIATSWSRIVSTPTSSSTSSAGACATHENHAGDRSNRRAVDAIRSGPPYDAAGGSALNQPARCGVSRSAASGRAVMNAHPRGASSHLYVAQTV